MIIKPRLKFGKVKLDDARGTAAEKLTAGGTAKLSASFKFKPASGAAVTRSKKLKLS